MINVFQPALGRDELAAVGRVFDSNWVGKGKLADAFESGFASFLGVDRALVRSASCCTEVMFQAVEALGLGPGDEVVLPTVSFVGAGNAVAHSGARPVFCDVDPRTLNATAATIEAKLGPRTRAVLPLHYGGLPADMDPILALAADKKLAVIEDSACSVASRYRGRACGTLGDFGAWSFDAMKILVTGDGGMAYCRRPEGAVRMEEGLYLGLATKSGLAGAQSLKSRWWEFSITDFGRRAIMNDVSAAIGIEQLRKLPGFIARRRAIHRAYDAGLKGLDWLRLPPAVPRDCESSYYFYWVQAEPAHRDALAEHLKTNGIYTTFRYYPLHRVARYGSADRLPAAERAAETTLCIPIHHSLTDGDVDRVIEGIRGFGRTL